MVEDNVNIVYKSSGRKIGDSGGGHSTWGAAILHGEDMVQAGRD